MEAGKSLRRIKMQSPCDGLLSKKNAFTVPWSTTKIDVNKSEIKTHENDLLSYKTARVSKGLQILLFHFIFSLTSFGRSGGIAW